VLKLTKSIFTCFLLIMNHGQIFSFQVQKSGGEVLTIESAVNIALKNNLQIKAARNSVDASKWGVRKAVTGLFPKVEVGQRLTEFDPETVWMANVFVDIAKEQFGVDVSPMMFEKAHATVFSVTQPIYNGGANLASIKIARITDKGNKFVLENTKHEIILQVKNAYYGYQKAKEMVTLQEMSRILAEENLKSARLRKIQGIGSDPDVLRWEV